MSGYTDPTTGEHVGEYEYRDADDPVQVRRDTEWFATAEEARRFSRIGHPAISTPTNGEKR